jgi:hypothetical protein
MRIVALVTFLLLSSTFVLAGSASEPEITDGSADATSNGSPACPPNPTACAGPGQVIDITAAWVKESEDMVTFFVQTLASEAHKAYGPMMFDAHFQVAGVEFTGGIGLGQSSTAGGDDAIDARGIAVAARIGTDVYEFDVLRSDLGTPAAGDLLAGLYITSAADSAGVSSTRTTDRAPDADGVDYVFTLGAADAGELIQLNVTGAPLEHVFNGTGAQYAINWTGPANVTMRLAAMGNGTFNLSITDPSGAEAYSCACPASNVTNDFTAVAGNWSIQIDYSAFNGTVTLSLAETLPAMMESESENGSQQTGNGTMDGNGTAEPASKDSPPAALPLLMVSVVVLALARRPNV